MFVRLPGDHLNHIPSLLARATNHRLHIEMSLFLGPGQLFCCTTLLHNKVACLTLRVIQLLTSRST